MAYPSAPLPDINKSVAVALPPDTSISPPPDDTLNLQGWLDDPRTIKILPAGIYHLRGTLHLNTGDVRILGAGGRFAVLTATTSLPILEIYNTIGNTISGVIIDGVGFDGNNLAPTGVYLKNVNFSYFNQVAVSDVSGYGLHLEGVQDTEFRGLDVRRCGTYPTGTAQGGVYIHPLITPAFDTNSLLFSGGDYEANRYPLVIDGASAIKFVGSKFHGILKDPTDPTDFPVAVDLMQLKNGASRIEVDACQFSNARRNGILLTDDASPPRPNITVRGCTFIEPANYDHTGSDASPVFTGEAWNINVESGRLIADDINSYRP